VLIALNKPYGVLCQFSPSGVRPTLADLLAVPAVYPAGRLDLDSEGLVLLTDDGRLQNRIAAPRNKMDKRYWVQVEGEPDEATCARLQQGVRVGDYVSRPKRAQRIVPPASLWPRDPPIRVRRNIPTAWMEIVLTEGKNRQVRRTTAAVGYPTLRLIRAAIGPIDLVELDLAPGRWVQLDPGALG
jgi:23S rRNA pseudouridine2457 synthase